MSTKVVEVSMFPELTFTQDSLSDVIKFINDGNVIALHTKVACCVFHRISFVKPENLASLNMVRVIYIDCNGHDYLLKDSQWPSFIRKAIKEVQELDLCAVKKAIIDQRKIFNKRRLRSYTKKY